MTLLVREYRAGRPLCMCRCGQPVARRLDSDSTRGWRKGDPCRYVRGHSRGLATYVVQPNGCWRWTGVLRKGYGRVTRAGKMYSAHRWMYEQEHGPIPEGLQLDHLCRNTWCVNPVHLEAVEPKVNVHRSTRTKLDAATVAEIRRLGEEELAQRKAQGFQRRSPGWLAALAARYGISLGYAWSIAGGHQR